MNVWTNYLADDASIKNIFHQEVPALDQVKVHEICLLRDGPGVSIRFDLAGYPDEPPKKWKAMGYNTIQLVLNAFDVEGVEVAGWKAHALLNLNIESVGGLILLSGKGEGIDFRITSRFLYLDKINAYRDGG